MTRKCPHLSSLMISSALLNVDRWAAILSWRMDYSLQMLNLVSRMCAVKLTSEKNALIGFFVVLKLPIVRTPQMRLLFPNVLPHNLQNCFDLSSHFISTVRKMLNKNQKHTFDQVATPSFRLCLWKRRFLPQFRRLGVIQVETILVNGYDLWNVGWVIKGTLTWRT